MVVLQKLKSCYINAQFITTPSSIWVNNYYLTRKHLFQEIKRLSPNLTGRVLDFGCGNKPYISLFEGREVVGIDIQESGNTYQGNAIDAYYDGKTLPFENQSFDSIFSSEVFEHIANLSEILGELHRVLKPKGKMLVTMPFIWGEHETPYDFSRFTSFGFAKLIETAGFKILEQKKTGNAVETLFQLWASYVTSLFRGLNIYVQILLGSIFVSPILLMGTLLGRLMPKRNDLYLNNVILVEKS